MSKTKPLPQYVKVDNQGETYIINSFSIPDIFTFGVPPFVIIAKSTGGKSTLLFDVLYNRSAEATNIYYFTQTVKQAGTDPLFLLPDICWVKPTLKNCVEVWEEIKVKNEAYNNISNKAGEIKALEIIRKLDPDNYITTYNKIQSHVNKKIEEYQKSESRDINVDAHVKNTHMILTLEITYKVMLKLVNDKRSELNGQLSEEDLMFIHVFYSERPKTILLFDDISSVLDAYKSSKKIVTSKCKDYNGMRESEAMNKFMVDLFTRGRHYNSLICLFIHDLGILADAIRKHINNFLLFESGLSAFMNQKTLFPVEKFIAKKIFDQLTTEGHTYCFVNIFGHDNDMIYNKNKLKLTYSRATLRLLEHRSDVKCELTFNKDFLSYVKFYEDFVSGVLPQIQAEKRVHESSPTNNSTEERNDIQKSQSSESEEDPIWSRPSDTVSIRPSDTASIRPSDTASIRPSDTVSVRPSDTTFGRPGTSFIRPSDTTFGRPGGGIFGINSSIQKIKAENEEDILDI